MAAGDFVDPFHRRLYPALVAKQADRIEHLAKGSAKRNSDDTTTVAEKYAAQVAYIQALGDVIEMCREIEIDMHGGRREEE